MKHREDQKRADYYLYTWQIKEVQRISRETRKPPSEVLRDLLSEALGAHRSAVGAEAEGRGPVNSSGHLH